MELFAKCKVCRKKRLYTAKRTYKLPYHPYEVTSDIPMCTRCFENQKLLTLGKWSIRHYIEYAIMRLTNLIHHDSK